MFILAHNTCCSFPTRIDIQHHVCQFRGDPWEEDGCKLENLRTSLVPLLAQLTQLQVASGYMSVLSHRLHTEITCLKSGTYLMRPLIKRGQMAKLPWYKHHNQHRMAWHQWTQLSPLSSRLWACPQIKMSHLAMTTSKSCLEKNQAKTHLNHLHELIAEKSFQYSNLIWGAPRKHVITRARGTVKGINMQISFHSQVYSQCQSRLIHISADTPTLQQFRELKRQDIRASTAILTPNEAGSTTLELSWIWHNVVRHILPRADADFSDNPATILECILFSIQLYPLAEIFQVRHVHWLCA